MMKRQPCGTSLSPSKLCRLLLIVFALKLAVLGMLVVEPDFTGRIAGLPGLSFLAQGEGAGTAVAATGAGAPPALEATLPDAGMSGSGGAVPPSTPLEQSPGSPSAAPGVAAPGPQESRTLPAIAPRSAASTPDAGGGAADADVRDSLARRQEDLARKEQELKVLESELNARLERMQMLENRIASMIKDAEETKDAKFRHLVDVLSNMKAKQAAAVLETLDPKIAVRVLAGMRGRQAGGILTFVKPTIAAKLTEDLARMQLPLE